MRVRVPLPLPVLAIKEKSMDKEKKKEWGTSILVPVYKAMRMVALMKRPAEKHTGSTPVPATKEAT